MLGSFNLDKTYLFLLLALAFLLPLTVFGGNLVVVAICVLWIISGDFKSKLNQITSNKLMLASILFFCIHLFGLLWTEDLSWGLHIVHKMWYFIGLFPILYTIVRKEYIRYYISAFLLAISITEIFSYLVWFEIIEPFKNATVENPTPFMSHISYNPILVFALYVVLHELFFNKKIINLVFFLYSFFAISMTINLFITGGRAGQVMFFAMVIILIFQYFNKQKLHAFLLSLILVPIIFFTAYQTSDLFHKRVDMAYQDITSYSDNKNTSLGKRITFTLNSLELIKDNLFFGVGTGDFPTEYQKINAINTPSIISPTNPHNMYILILTQLGLLGLGTFLLIFYYQYKASFNSSNKFVRNVGFTLPTLFLLIMWSDSYLLGHYTSLLFIFFSSFLYKNFEKS
jgi:O-antigen ligase